MTEPNLPLPPEHSRGNPATPSPALPFPVAGIGASAGGLDALKRLVSRLRPDPGMAFIVVEHLDPTRESFLADILAQSTQLPVHQAEDGEQVERNHVYVIPPNVNLGVAGGRMRFLRRDESPAPHLPIDYLFRSLAEDQQSLAVGVVLSGSGADGTQGVCEIKAAGGITFSQAPATAQFDAMPTSAIRSTSIDFILAPEEIGGHLSTIGAHPYLAPVPATDLMAGSHREALFRQILTIIQNVTGVDFSLYRSTTIKRRIMRRMAVNGKRSLEAYLPELEADRAEVDALFRDLLINVTSFFRDPSLFEALKKEVFPALMEGRPPTMPIRVWVPGCSSGQEAYSIAMALTEFFDDLDFRPLIQIFATDLADPVTLDRARAGVYPDTIEAEVSAARLQRFFQPVDGNFRVEKSIRDMCIFARQNVTADPPFSHLDIISCRNVLIYLETPLQQRLLPTFHYALNPNGFLILGTAETVGDQADLFELIDRSHKIYARRAGSSRIPLRPLHSSSRPSFPLPTLMPRPAASGPYDLQKEADRVLLSRFAPPGVLLNSRFEVLQFRGRTGRYLESPTGEPTTSVLKLAREGLFFELRSALNEVTETGTVTTRDQVPFRHDGELVSLRIEVLPVRLPHLTERGYLVLFDEQPRASGTAVPPAPGEATVETEELLQLRREVVAMREYLQALIEQQYTSNEDLRAANEEILSGNEELQSANEELETAKEELQCANEELTTVNEQLQQRNVDLIRSNYDLVNFLSSADLPLMMVDRDLRLQRITDAARRILDLHMEDAGFPVSYLQAALPVEDLATRIQQVMTSFESLQQEIQDRTGRWYLLRIHPYRAGKSDAEGAVLVLLDIDARKRSEEDLRETDRRKSEFLATVAHELRNPLGPIRQAVDVLRRQPATERGANAVAIMDRQVRQLAQLVTDLVDISVLGREHIMLRPERVALDTVLPAVQDSCSASLNEAGLQLVSELPDEPVILLADPVRLAQVLSNLIDNAIKFSTPGGTITIRATHGAGDGGPPMASLEVRDEGVGIAPELLPHVFELFRQGENGEAKRRRGFGIGLNLVHRLVTLHGGAITVESLGRNQGTTVTVQLPEADVSAARQRAHETQEAPEEIPPQRILLVDDNEDQTAMLQTLLRLAGHEVEIASDGRSGLARARAFRPDVAILDIGLPDINGHELARSIRAEPMLRETFLIAQTGWGQPSDRAAGAAAGFDVHLVKPVSFDMLQDVLRAGRPSTPA